MVDGNSIIHTHFIVKVLTLGNIRVDVEILENSRGVIYDIDIRIITVKENDKVGSKTKICDILLLTIPMELEGIRVDNLLVLNTI